MNRLKPAIRAILWGAGGAAAGATVGLVAVVLWGTVFVSLPTEHVLEYLCTQQEHSIFLIGFVAFGALFGLGAGVYKALSKPPPPDRGDPL